MRKYASQHSREHNQQSNKLIVDLFGWPFELGAIQFSPGAALEKEFLLRSNPGEKLHQYFYQTMDTSFTESEEKNPLLNYGWIKPQPLDPRRQHSIWNPNSETAADYDSDLQLPLLRHLMKSRSTLALMLERRSWRVDDRARFEQIAAGTVAKPPVLLTPSLVEMRRWVSGSENNVGVAFNWMIDRFERYVVGVGEAITRTSAHSMTLDEQMEVMQLLAEKRPEGLLVHPFVPYDPWQGAVDMIEGRADTGLRFVREAVEQRGAIGIKLYPPMGFRASDNRSISARAKTWTTPSGVSYDNPAFRKELENAVGRERTGDYIDRALDGLYKWCAREGVPILAHTGPSHAGNGEQRYFCRAFPGYWRSVFENPRYQGLRVDLGHFGGIWNLPLNRDTPMSTPSYLPPPGLPDAEAAKSPNGSASLCGFYTDHPVPSDPNHIAWREWDTRRWPEEVADLIRKYPDRVFADFGDAPMPVSDDSRNYDKGFFKGRFDKLVQRFYGQEGWAYSRIASGPDDPIWNNIMYGSDFPFIMIEPTAWNYRAEMEKRLGKPIKDHGFGLSPERVNGVMCGNAARFLGLTYEEGPHGATLRRLREFHLKNLYFADSQTPNGEAIVDQLFAPFVARAGASLLQKQEKPMPNRRRV